LKILFVTATRIGDAVLSTGLLSHLIDRYPKARLTIAAGPVAAPLFEAVPGLEQLIPLVKLPRAGHWRALWRRTVGTRWDLAVDLRGSALVFLLWAGQRKVMGKGNPAEHRVRQLARLFRLEPPPSPRLWISSRHEADAARLVPPGGPVLAIGPAANWRGKQWRDTHFAELGRRLIAPGGEFEGARVAVLAAEHERPQAEALLAALPAGQLLDLVGRVDLLTAAAVLRRTEMFIGNDTGLMHIAAAAGCPTLGLFGPGSEVQYGPWGERSAVVRTPIPPAVLMGDPAFDHRTTDTLMDSLTVEAVTTAVATLHQRIGTL
jgi:ADP-heptose:LPS heptosyltransferase